MKTPDIHELTGSELERANEIYDDLDFVRSVPPQYRTFGLFEDDRLVALSRIVRFDDGGIELGGIWTHPGARGVGLARRMVEHVLARTPAVETCYLIAFDHLADFYRSCGLADPPPDHVAPESIVGKQGLCSRREDAGRYGPTVLLWRPGH